MKKRKQLHAEIVKSGERAHLLTEQIFSMQVKRQKIQTLYSSTEYPNVGPKIAKETGFQKLAKQIASPFDKVRGTVLTDFIGDKMGTSKYSKHKKMFETYAKDLGTTYNYSRKEHNKNRRSDSFDFAKFGTEVTIYVRFLKEQAFKQNAKNITLNNYTTKPDKKVLYTPK